MVMEVPLKESLENLLEYIGFFQITVESEPTESLNGFIAKAGDPFPTEYVKTTIRSDIGTIAVAYINYEGYEISFPKEKDPDAENDIEVIKDDELVYLARVISTEELLRLKALYESDEAYAMGDVNQDLEKVGRNEFYFQKKPEGNDPDDYYLYDLLGSGAGVYAESHLVRSGSFVETAHPYFWYSLAK